MQLRPINIGRDYGTTLEILGGVEPDGPNCRQSIRLAGGRPTGECCAACSRVSRSQARVRTSRKAERSEADRSHVRGCAARAGSWMHGGSALQPPCRSGCQRLMHGSRNHHGSKPRPRMRFLKANGGKFSTIPISMLTSNNCCKRTSRWWRRAIDWNRHGRWRGSRRPVCFHNLSADPSATRERGSGNRPLNGSSPVIVNGAAQPILPYTQNVYEFLFR